MNGIACCRLLSAGPPMPAICACHAKVLQGLAEGAVDIVIGTHAVAVAGFKRLGLVVIDEEQRFGEAHKLALRHKRAGLHALIMTATPLPRTLQGALVGVVNVSQLASSAGHLRLIGTELYRHLLTRALARSRGEAVADEFSPTIVAEAEALVPHDFIPEADVRLEIYRRLARTRSMDALEDLAEELADRFGSLPKPLLRLLEVARLRLLSVQHGLAAVHAGPNGSRLPGTMAARTVLDGTLGPVGDWPKAGAGGSAPLLRVT